MKIKVNRNILWAEVFFNNLVEAGVRYTCISPGSRSTPLTYAAAVNPGLKSFVHIDERSAAFFAGGLARKSGAPVILICTSGTAAAEFYPGIIEAYQQRIPLIICTADRPDGSFLKGLNQTINQHNLYANHIRWFYDAGLPDVNKIDSIKNASLEAYRNAIEFQGPVHINFPFDKPFEPENHTDEVNDIVYDLSEKKNLKVTNSLSKDVLENVSNEIISCAEGIITVGPSSFSSEFRDAILRFSEISGYPVLADGASQLRFGKSLHKNIITNYDAAFRSGNSDKFKPGLIMHFGRTMTSKGYDDFLMKYNGKKILINKFSQTFDPSGRFNALISSDEEVFLKNISDYLTALGFSRRNSLWLEFFQEAEAMLCKLKLDNLQNALFPDESRIINELLDLIPDGYNLMLSNSSPVRDFDYFAGQTSKDINIFHNRGASGIDGINSTALGIAAVDGKTVLLTGDLAFYHDLNGLLASSQYNIPLIVILINNNGGGIFKALPISGHGEVFQEYFYTPHNLTFRSFTEAYEGNHRVIVSWEEFRIAFSEALQNKKLNVLEIKTNADVSLSNRRKYWQAAGEILNDNSII